MKCKYCKHHCVKNGFQNNGIQRYKCTSCGKRQQEDYSYMYYVWDSVEEIISLMVKNSCGIRNISRILKISTNTVIIKIKKIASRIEKPEFKINQSFELDEMQSVIGNKENRTWIIYSLEKETKQIVDFVVGRRTAKNAGKVTEKLLQLYPKVINTDKLNIYPSLIPSKIHKTNKYGTNHIERKNLTLRTNLKGSITQSV